MRAMFAMRPTTLKRLAAVSVAGFFTLASTEFAKQGGHGHAEHHAQVPNQISTPYVLSEKPEESRSKKSKAWATCSVVTAVYGYALTKIYQNYAKSATKQIRPWVFGASLGVLACVGVLAAFNTGANSVVREIAINRDLRTVTIRTGILTDAIHTLKIKDIRPLHNGDFEGFKAQLENGSVQTFFLPDESRLEGQGYTVSNTQLYHDLVTGNFDAVAKYHFSN